jgi:tRNA (guanine-N7-)-methyltransferase
LKTDSNFQYSYTSALVHLNEFEILAETDNLYESEILNETLRIKTFYEKQWLSRGIPIKYLAFRLNDKEWQEPEMNLKKMNTGALEGVQERSGLVTKSI